LVNWSQVVPNIYQMKKRATVLDLRKCIADQMGTSAEHISVCLFAGRLNNTFRPGEIIRENHTLLSDLPNVNLETNSTLRFLVLENAYQMSPYKADDKIVFLKYFDVETDNMYYLSHIFLSPEHLARCALSLAIDKIPKRGLGPRVNLSLYEEVHQNRTDELTPTKRVREMENLCDGDIWVIQVIAHLHYDIVTADFVHNNVQEYFQDLEKDIEIEFEDIQNEGRSFSSFKLHFKRKMCYNEVAKAVATHLLTEPHFIRFYHDGRPYQPILSTYTGIVYDLFPKKTTVLGKLLYEKLDTDVKELEGRRRLKATPRRKSNPKPSPRRDRQ